MKTFDINCTACPRLAEFLAGLRQQYPHYHNLPVAPFGDPGARLLIVGLAPGMHGANASGRPFTGDHAGILLYQTLHKFGFADRPQSLHKDDGLTLLDCRITNAVKCLPPQNKPVGSEVNNCNHFIRAELEALPPGAVIMALGSIAHTAVLKTLGFKLAAYKFAHNALHELPQGYYLLDTYHCSRYNTNTRRLTTEMFEAVVCHRPDLLAHRADL
ncbi:MAG: uracil-DNA glycosylase [Thiolinea sp.]